MLRAVFTLSVLAVLSFALSTVAAVSIAAHAATAKATTAGVLPAVVGAPVMTCPALFDATAPACPALAERHRSVTRVVEAARRAGCAAFTGSARTTPPGPTPPTHRSVVTASHDGLSEAPDASS